MNDMAVGFVVGVVVGAIILGTALIVTGRDMRSISINVATAACQQQGYQSGTYEDGKVICENVTRVELGK